MNTKASTHTFTHIKTIIKIGQNLLPELVFLEMSAIQ